MDYNEVKKNWQNKKITDEADLKIALENFRILFAYNSNKIENPMTTYHDTREIFENGRVENYSGDLRTIFEIQNQKECFHFLTKKIIERSPLDENLIKEIHGILMKGCYDQTRYEKGERPGQYKIHDYVVGDEVGIAPEDVADEIRDLCQQVNEYEGSDILTAAAFFHLSFEAVHPFADGNGRVGRTLLNYYLMIHDYPPTIIYNEDKATYYMALAAFDKTGKIDGFIAFLREQTVKTWTRKKVLPKLKNP
ncbi:MAG TPA: Fic family protein [Candidatus Mediterraneibacter cottocaccae]|nr:Fic family protein [Candidatus Mediterraneibacter cottocaccae]